MRIRDFVDNIGKKRLIIIASIFIALLILIANGKYKYNFSIYDDTNYSTWWGYGLLVE